MTVRGLLSGKKFDTLSEAAIYYNTSSTSMIRHAEKNDYYLNDVFMRDSVFRTKSKEEINNIISFALHLSLNKKPNANSKLVICLNTGEVFSNAIIAAKKYGADNSYLHKCCKNKVKSAGKRNDIGLTWMYYKDYINADVKYIYQKINKIK